MLGYKVTWPIKCNKCMIYKQVISKQLNVMLSYFAMRSILPMKI